MDAKHETAVLIVGGGPIGMVLAASLRSRNIPALVVERRGSEDPWTARCNHIASRSMEIFRRLGFADSIRERGLPDDYPTDVAWASSGNDYEIARLPLASRATRFTDRTVADADWSTPEPAHRCSQMLFDPVLQEQALAAGVSFVNSTTLIGYRETGDGVIATVRPADGAPDYEIKCQYMVGCDGGSSTVRKLIGARLEGDDELFRARSLLIRAPWMLDHLGTTPAWMTNYLGPGPFGTVIAIDGHDQWLVHLYLPYGETDFEKLDIDRDLRGMIGLPDHLEWETIHQQDWVARRFVADRFRKGRVFICGDAAHLWPPYGGFGMNCGIADADNLAWLLAGVLNGWGDEKLLDCYEAERQPVTDQVSRFVMEKVLAYLSVNHRRTGPVEFNRDDETGEKARAEMAVRLHTVQGPQYAAAGLNYGYYYESSPAIVYDGESAPPYDMGTYRPSTVPGCRLPHFWTAEGASLYDLLGPDYALIRLDPSVPVAEFQAAAALRGVPLTVLDTPNRHQRLYRHKLILVRPDRHIAWRGDALPADPLHLVDLIRGAVALQAGSQADAAAPELVH